MKLIEQRRQGALFFSFTLCLNIGDHLKTGLKKFVPRGYRFNKMACSHDEIRWFFDEEDLIEAGTILTEQLWNNRQQVNLLFELFNKTRLLTQEYCVSIANKRLQHVPTEELVQITEDYFPIYGDLFNIGTFAELLDFSFQTLIKKELENQKIPSRECPAIISTLSTPEEESFSREAEKSILKIASRIQEKRLSIPKAFRDKEIKELLEDHLEQFYWISCNYFSFSGLGMKNLKALVQAACESETSPKHSLEYMGSEEKKLAEKKAFLQKKFRLNEKTLFYFGLAKGVAKLYDNRKKSQMHGFYSIGRILKELAKRKNIPFDLAKYALPSELDALVAGSLSVRELEKRRGHFFVDFNVQPLKLLTGESARKAEEILWKTSTLSQDDISGSCACPGTVVGTARVIRSKKQLHELQPNEILVTGMTDPDFVPFLRKAIGIITDDGGITSHSAIISRELKIPCIVGTKTATRKIKTGDLVDLRAHHGLARVIERIEKTV